MSEIQDKPDAATRAGEEQAQDAHPARAGQIVTPLEARQTGRTSNRLLTPQITKTSPRRSLFGR